ncbi:solute carrier family 26 member 10-like [Armigeres subalbatus]|uniref:solute carrier family 26 member 10-like n=1 Tax=Armigeres subalbatus TaxID=124917 RepID=UPI002ED32240
MHGNEGSPDRSVDGVTNHGFFQDLVDEGIKSAKTAPAALAVTRPLYQQEDLNHDMQYNEPKRSIVAEVLNSVKGCSAKQWAKSVFPIVGWMSEYSWKKDIVSDLISGCTVAVMQIPQGMGYALLANVPPIVGIYMAFFPVLVYFVLGTSRHNSMGTFAVVCIMVGKVVLKYANQDDVVESGSKAMNDTLLVVAKENSDGATVGPIEVASAICFIVGIMQLIMYVGRLGVISFLLSDALVSGFTTGAAIHVLTSQIKDLLGISLPAQSGNFEVINTYIAIFTDITKANWATIVISAVTIVVVVVNNEYLKPIVAKRSSIPVPIELIAVISGTLISKYASLQAQYNIKPIGNIPTGFPEPTLPNTDLMTSLLLDSFPIAMVAYAVSVSMALIFAQKQNYEIDFNQELLAMGTSNVFASFFSCLPFAASLSRSMIQYTAGGRTQIAAVISCGILAIVLLWIGPFFEPLPRCVLAGIIVVSLKGLLMQVKQFRPFWNLSNVDGIVWMATFLTVALVAIDIGLLVGIVLSICTIFFRGLKPYTCILENVPNTDLYLDVNRYKGTIDIPGIKIFHFCGSLNFASRTSFKTRLCETLGLNLTQEIKNSKSKGYKRKFSLRYLVLDFTALSSIDPSAIAALKALIAEFNKLSVKVLVAGLSCPVYEKMVHCKLVGHDDQDHCKAFPTIHDAVLWAQDASANDSGQVSIMGSESA